MRKGLIILDNINRLLNRLELLEEKVDSLEQTIRRFSATFLPNPRYPYWHMLISLGISEEKKSDLESILFILNDRLLGKKFIIKQDDEISDEMINEIANSGNSGDRIISFSAVSRFPDTLVKDSPPVWEESLAIISSILEIPYEDTIKRILCAMREQSMFEQLINYLLNEN